MDNTNKSALHIGDDGEIEGLPLPGSESKKKKGVPTLWRIVTRNHVVIRFWRIGIIGLSLWGCIAGIAFGKSAIDTIDAIRCPDLIYNVVTGGNKLAYLSIKKDKASVDPHYFPGLDDLELFVMDVDGTNFHPLGKPKGESMWMALSPDGKSIAYIKSIDNGNSIYGGKSELIVADWDGSNSRPVLQGKDIKQVVWSPNSKQLAALVLDWIQFVIDVVDIDGSTKLHLKNDIGFFDINWLLDGKAIAYLSEKGNFTIANVDDGSQHALSLNLTGIVGVSNYLPSPNGQHIAFIGNRSIYITDADGTNRRQLISNSDNTITKFFWSPDSKQIAYLVSSDRGSRLNIYTIGVAETSPRALTDTLEVQKLNTVIDWLPDGQHILFVSRKNFGDHQGKIYSVGIDGSDLKRVCARWPF